MAIAGPVPLSGLTRAHADLFGAKAVNLGRMIRWQMPVPDGFAVAVPEGQGAALAPSERDAIVAAYADLAGRHPELSASAGPKVGPAVAVRSSAAGEDSRQFSFAGQHDTFLGVVGTEPLIDAISQCFASRASDRAQAYRHESQVPQRGSYRTWEDAGAPAGAMGVVVQLMAPAEYAGVCFTRSPEAENETVLELIRGLGEDLVAGRKRPARIRFTRPSLDPVSEDDHEGLIDTFGRSRAAEVVRVALEAEAHFAIPLDIEWAYAKGEVLILQARPITAQIESAEMETIRREEIDRARASAGNRVCVWSDFSVRDMMPRPVPLYLDIFSRAADYEGGIGRSYRRLGFRYARDEGTKRCFEIICGRAYINLSASIHAALSHLPVTVNAAKLRAIPAGAFDPVAIPTKIDWREWRKVLRMPFALLRLVAVVPGRFFRLRREFHREYIRKAHPRVTAEARSERERELSRLSPSELWQLLSEYVGRIAGDLIYNHQLSDYVSFATHALLVRNIRTLYGDGAEEMEARLTTALDGNFNTQTNLALAEVAAGRLGLDVFLDRYGHRGNPDWDIAAPRWREDRRPVERMLDALRRSGVNAAEKFQEQRRVRLEAEERFSTDIKRNWSLRPWHGLIMRELRIYQRYSPLREITQSACYLWIELARRVLIEAGRRADAGDLLFHLPLCDLERYLTGGTPRSLLDEAQARRRRLRLARRIHVPHVLFSDDLEAIGRPPEVTAAVHELRGLSVSAGVVQGRARVVAGLEDAADLEPGEILVAAGTDPAWTPLFFVAGGLVLEQGGMLSHGAIVAREQGLPAVVNVPDATRLIANGQEITLDATSGRVILTRAVSRRA